MSSTTTTADLAESASPGPPELCIHTVVPGEESLVTAAGHLFDDPPTEDWTARFLQAPGHHLLIAFVDDEPAGFVSGMELTHPDKGTEIVIYELGVDEGHRRRGIARALIGQLIGIGASSGCYGMFVTTEPDNIAAQATYRAAGFDSPESTVTFSRGL